MLYKAMPTLPVSDLRTRQSEIIATLQDTPVMLTNRGEGAGVLVHPKVWNQLVEEVERHRLIANLLQTRKEMIAGEYQTLDEIEADLKQQGRLE